MDNLINSRAFMGIKEHIEAISGIVINGQNGHLLEHKLEHIFHQSSSHNLEDLYYNLCVKKEIRTAELIIEAVTTNETFWFRDQGLWTFFESAFLPEQIKKLRSGECKTIKIWSGACSSGQEPYSMAMTIQNFLNKLGDTDITLEHFEIIATDISAHILSVAQMGQYDKVAMSRGINEQDKEKYFVRDGKNYQIIDHIRSAVTFKQGNLMDASYGFEVFDLVLLRNVLIYFSKNKKRAIYEKIALALKTDGKLCIGSSELIDDDSMIFSRRQYNNSVYFIKNKEVSEYGRRLI